MDLRIIKSEQITECIKDLLMDCNYNIPDDVYFALKKSRQTETSEIGKDVLSQIIQNDDIAKKEKIPICQDCGMAVIFCEYGDHVIVEGETFEDAINRGVKKAYIEGYLRKSVVDDPVFDRINTKDNTPAVIHTKIVHSNNINFTVGCKGFGSENMSKIAMLTPSQGIEGIKKFVIDTVKYAGPNPCPPIIVGVGIGGTFEKAAELSKLASFRELNSSNKDLRYKQLEEELLDSINKLNIGPAGLKGSTTCIKVNIESYPTHIAGLPVAVNICCHASRHKKGII